MKNLNLRTLGIATLIAAGSIALPGIAGTVANLTTFTANTPARAAEVNGNFTAVKTAVDDNQAQITALNARIAALEAQLTNITALNAYLSLQTVNGHPTVRVAAANLQVVNGAGSTAQVNGLGNLIVGYDEARPDTATLTCSIATANSISSQADCTTANGVWAANHKDGSHNLIIGTQNNYSGFASVVFGERNAVTGEYASVMGGQANIAGGKWATVVDGLQNQAWGIASVVTGGSSNLALGDVTHISGGQASRASGTNSVVLGGFSNVASGDLSAIVGGRSNQAPGIATAVGGGVNNTALGNSSTVSGGVFRTAVLDGSWAAGTYSSNQ